MCDGMPLSLRCTLVAGGRVVADGRAAGGGADNAHRKHAKRYFTHVDR